MANEFINDSKITTKQSIESALDIIDKKLNQKKLNDKDKIMLLKEKTATILSHLLPLTNKEDFTKYNQILEETADELSRLGEITDSHYVLGLKYLFEWKYELAESYLFEVIQNWKHDAISDWLKSMESVILQYKDNSKTLDLAYISDLGNKISELAKIDYNNIFLYHNYITVLNRTNNPVLLDLALSIAYFLVENQKLNEFVVDIVSIYINLLQNNIQLDWDISKDQLFHEAIDILDSIKKQVSHEEVLFLGKIYELYWDLYLAYRPESKIEISIAKDYYYKALEIIYKINPFELDEPSINKIVEELSLKLLNIEETPNERLTLIDNLTFISPKYFFEYVEEYLLQNKPLFALETLLYIYQNHTELWIDKLEAKNNFLTYINAYLKPQFYLNLGKLTGKKTLWKIESKIKTVKKLNYTDINFLIKKTITISFNNKTEMKDFLDIIDAYTHNLEKSYFNIILLELIRKVLWKDYTKCLNTEVFQKVIHKIENYLPLNDNDIITLKLFIDAEEPKIEIDPQTWTKIIYIDENYNGN